MKSYIFLSILISICFSLLSINVLAKTFVIHATGIDAKNTSQNYIDFYENANSFEKYCHEKNKEVECTLYINNDKSLMEKPQDTSYELNKGAPTKKEVLDNFTKILQNAKAEDQIIFSLNNHGYNKSEFQSSCISLNGSSEEICANDLANVLKSNTNNAKVFIIAEACFTGAFTKYSSKRTCTFVQADTMRTGHGLGFWNLLLDIEKNNNKKYITLNDFKKEIHISSTFSWQSAPDGAGFASQFISNEFCALKKNNLIDKSKVEFIKFLEEIEKSNLKLISDINSCKKEVYNENARNLTYYFNTELKALNLDKAFDFSETINFLNKCKDEYFCSSKLEKLTLTPEFEKNKEEFMNLYKQISTVTRSDLFKFSEIDSKYENALKKKISAKQRAILEAQRGQNFENYMTYIKDITSKLENNSYLKMLANIRTELCTKIRNFREEDTRHTQVSTAQAGIEISNEKLKDAEECEQNFVLP